MGLFDGMAQGLRAAGSVLSPQVGQQLEQERLLGQQQDYGRQNLMLTQLLKASESGAIDPAIASKALGQFGIQLPDGAIGPTPEARAKIAALRKEQQRVQYLQSPEAKQFIDKNDDTGLLRDMYRRGLASEAEVIAAMKEAREARKPISFGGGKGYQPDGQGGGSMLGGPSTTAPHTIEQEYQAPDGTTKKRVLQYDAQMGGYVPAKVFDAPQAPAQPGPQPGEPTANMQGDPRAVMAEIQRISDPAERAAALQAYRTQLAQVQPPQGAPIYKPTNAVKPPNGYRFSADGKSLEAIPGGPAANGPIDPAAVASAAGSVASGMPLTQVVPGYGRQVAGQREAVRVAAINQIKAQTPGMTDEQAGQEYANRQIEFASGKKSAGQLTTMLGATKQAVDQLDFNVDKVTGLMKSMQGSDLSPLINGIIRQEEKWTGDPKYAQLYYYMHASAMESARILQGGQASIAQLHAGAAEEAKKWASANMTTPAQWVEGVAPAMKEEGRERIKTYERAIASQKVGASRQPLPTDALRNGGYVETRTTADGRTLGKKADGTIEEIKK